MRWHVADFCCSAGNHRLVYTVYMSYGSTLIVWSWCFPVSFEVCICVCVCVCVHIYLGWAANESVAKQKLRCCCLWCSASITRRFCSMLVTYWTFSYCTVVVFWHCCLVIWKGVQPVLGYSFLFQQFPKDPFWRSFMIPGEVLKNRAVKRTPKYWLVVLYCVLLVCNELYQTFVT